MGITVLLDLVANEEHAVKKLVVVSSMSIYGKGAYKSQDSLHSPRLRSDEQMARHEWGMRDPATGEALAPVPKPLEATSVYILSKNDQAEYCRRAARSVTVANVVAMHKSAVG